MKQINNLSKDLDKIYNKVISNLMAMQQNVARQGWELVVENAPTNSGEYISSIQVSDTEFKDDIISTKIFTDLKSEDGHLIGRMIENGTGIYALEPHIGKTKTFLQSGYNYWYVPAKSVKAPIGQKIMIKGEEFYIAKAQPSKPHFKAALDTIKPLYRDKIAKTIEEAFK